MTKDVRLLDTDPEAGDMVARRDALLKATLPEVPFDGWSLAALRRGAAAIGMPEYEIPNLFPRGGADLVDWFDRWADRQMLEAIDTPEFHAQKVRHKIMAAVEARLALLAPHREAVRRALALRALPQNAPAGLRSVYRTVDAIWYAAGDTATDFNFYTKRALLAAVYSPTVLYWLGDRSPDSAETKGFLERRLADVMKIPSYGARLRSITAKLPNPFRIMGAARR
jgi:ubiquinone biosynthesis protein COQ9